MAAAHQSQDPGGTRLRRQVQVLADLRQIAEGLDQPPGDVARMRAGEPDAIDSLDILHKFQQAGEVAVTTVRRLIVVHDLPQQMYFAASGGGSFGDLRNNLRGRPHPLVAARVRDDAEGAEVVTSLDNGDERLDRITSNCNAERKRDVFVRVDVDLGDAAATGSLDGARQSGECAGPNDDIDHWRPVEELIPFLLRHAAGDCDDRPRLHADVTVAVKAREQLLRCPLAHAAGVHNHQVHPVNRRRQLIARLVQQSCKALAVVDVHLTSERLDAIGPSHR